MFKCFREQRGRGGGGEGGKETEMETGKGMLLLSKVYFTFAVLTVSSRSYVIMEHWA